MIRCRGRSQRDATICRLPDACLRRPTMKIQSRERADENSAIPPCGKEALVHPGYGSVRSGSDENLGRGRGVATMSTWSTTSFETSCPHCHKSFTARRWRERRRAYAVQVHAMRLFVPYDAARGAECSSRARPDDQASSRPRHGEPCDRGRCIELLSACVLDCLMRSRVTPKARPGPLEACAAARSIAERSSDHLTLRARAARRVPSRCPRGGARAVPCRTATRRSRRGTKSPSEILLLLAARLSS